MRPLAILFVFLFVACSECVAEKPASGEARQIKGANLPALMLQHKPPYAGIGGPPDPAITFDRVDVIIERGFPGPAQTPYLSIGRNGGYLYKIDALNLPGGQVRPAANLVERLPPARLTELQRLLEATKWLTAPGGEGAATHTDADVITLAITRDGKTQTIKMHGQRPAPYTALQKFFYDLAAQENLYYRLTRVPGEQIEAIRELHDAIESALGRPGRQPPRHDFTFERYHDLFSGALDQWYARQPDELSTAVDLMVLLKRDTHAAAVARLRYDRDSNLRSTVARALPVLHGEKAISLLADMIESTAEARLSLIGLGEPAVPTIASIIEPDVARENPRSVALIRAYIDHWKELPQPVDPRVLKAVIANMQLEKVRARGMSYHRELLKLAGAPEPKPATALETAKLFLKHLKAGDEAELEKLRDNVGSIEKWLVLRESFDPSAEVTLETLFIDKTSGFFVTRPFQNKAGHEIHVVVFMNLARGTDWRVGPALEEPAQRTLYKDRFLESHPGAQETRP